MADRSLFAEGLASLLSQEADVQVFDTDERTLLRQAVRLRPSAILVTEASPADSMRLLRLLQGLPLPAIPRLLAVRSDANWVDVYHYARVVVRDRHGLIDLIRNGRDVP
jgi:hypothetical protein